MSTIKEPTGSTPEEPSPPLDYGVAEGFRESAERRQLGLIGLALIGLVSVMALVVALISLADGNGGDTAVTASKPAAARPAAVPAADKAAPTLADSKGV